MDSIALMQHLRKERPALRVLLMTGYADLRQSAIDASGIIRKPFDVAPLTGRTEQMLQRPMLRALPGRAPNAL
jgi:DNA-binding NtrC family response regulator